MSQVSAAYDDLEPVTEAQQENSMMSLIPAEDGDLELVVGPQRERIRVYIFMLKVASKPFGALLGPNFKEGQASNPTGKTKEINLPEDDPEAMRSICMVLHYLGDKLDSTPPSELLLSIAALADKYDCVGAIRAHAKLWVSNNYKKGNSDDRFRTLTAAYILDDPLGFTKTSAALVLHRRGPFYVALDAISSLMLPLGVLCQSYHAAACVELLG